MAAANKYKSLVLQRDTDSRVDTLTFNNPASLNALSPLMQDELLHYFQSLVDDDLMPRPGAEPQPRVVVLRGTGRAFCAGLDLKAGMQTTAETESKNFGPEMGPIASFRSQRRISEIVVRMRRCKQPIIAVLQGAVCGGGLALALGSDVRLATDTMKANVAMATIGLSGCDIGISYLLPRLVGASVAAEMMMTGRFLKAQRAHTLGFVSEVYPSMEELDKGLQALLKDMLGLGEFGLAMTKDGLNHALSSPSLEASVAMEDRQQVLAAFDGEFVQRVANFRKKSRM